MTIQFPSSEEFQIKPFALNGEMLYLIQPNHIGTKWTRDNLIFRSSIWTPEGEPVSLGFPKFFNFHEQPELNAPPKTLRGCELIEKLDGSCLIVSLYKNNLIVRTRGTTDATQLTNGYEIATLKAKYPRAFDLANRLTVRDGTADHTLIYEWLSPTNKIVINYGEEPELYLTGIINHNDYSLLSQKSCDEMAAILHVKRPRRFKFDTIEEMIAGIEGLKGQEGIVMYYNSGQEMRKVKSAWYLALHSLKSNLTTDKLVDMWFIAGCPEYGAFCDEFQKTWDWETFNWAQGAISNMFEGIKEYNKIVAHLKTKVDERRGWTRKDFAISAQKEYGSTKKFSALMNLYLGQQIEAKTAKHILLQNTKQIELGMFKNIPTKEEEL
jgi:hypothetical protein